MEEHVVLVDDDNKVLGTIPKATVHTKNTPLHRAFSSFIFNPKGEILLSQRSGRKKTWPLVWTNSCCGHPALEEKNIDAVKRRLKYKLGLNVGEIYEILPNYRYRAEKDGVVENELCPVYIAFTDHQPNPNKKEVESIRWMLWSEFVIETHDNPQNWSPWCVEQVQLLQKNGLFHNLINENANL